MTDNTKFHIGNHSDLLGKSVLLNPDVKSSGCQDVVLLSCLKSKKKT